MLGQEDVNTGSGTITAEAIASVANSLSLTAEAWLTIKSIGACSCCAARLAGCSNQVAYSCDEHELRAHIDALFMKVAHEAPQGSSAVTQHTTNMIMTPTCTLCLGLLQPEVPLLMEPRSRSSGESRGDNERSCVVSSIPPNEPASCNNSTTSRDGEASTAVGPSRGEEDANDKQTCSDKVATDKTEGLKCQVHHGRVRLGNAIIECAAARGYTVSSFGITAGLPACLAVRDASFMVTYGKLFAGATADSVNAAVSVKDALKLALGGVLQVGFEAPQDPQADFIVEFTAKAPAADIHAMKILGIPTPSQSESKPPSWDCAGRLSKKRQRRETQRNPGLTVGAVKKGLSTLSDEVKDRMKKWMEGLRADGVVREEIKNREQTDVGEGTSKQCIGDVRSAEGEKASIRVDYMDVENGHYAAHSEGDKAMVAICAQKDTERYNNTERNDTGAGDNRCRAQTEAARCGVVIRRQSLYYWGRYTKLSRSVPQTPWIRGFYSVQEAISEPFEALTGCIEGMLHGAGREDMDVRMLGNGRPFSLELVDSLLSKEEVNGQLVRVTEAVNTATGRKNTGGGVAISHLRAASVEDLPCEVQKVGEGKRKHYRCVVWVSRVITQKELDEMCDQPELVVQQSTPLRVLHRRTLLDRPRSIFDMRAKWINDHFFVLDIKTSAGEWIVWGGIFAHVFFDHQSSATGLLCTTRIDMHHPTTKSR